MSIHFRLKVTRRIPAISMRLVEGKGAVDVERSVPDQGEMESDDRRKGVLKNSRKGEGRGGGKWERGGGGGRREEEEGRGGEEKGGEGSRGIKQREKGKRRLSGGKGVRDEDRGAERERLPLTRTSEQKS